MINENIHYSLKREIDTPNAIFSSKKSVIATAAITAVALSALAFAASTPSTALGMAPGLFFINFFTIPTALKYGSTSFAKTVIIVSFVAFGSLVFGWGSVFAFSSITHLTKDLFSESLASSILRTWSLLSIPSGLKHLKIAREMILSETWHKAIANFQGYWNDLNSGFSVGEMSQVHFDLLDPIKPFNKPSLSRFSLSAPFIPSSEFKENFKKLVKILKIVLLLDASRAYEKKIFHKCPYAISRFLHYSSSSDYDECAEYLLKNEDQFPATFLSNCLRNRPPFIEKKIIAFLEETKQFDNQLNLLKDLSQDLIELESRIAKALENSNEDEIKNCISSREALQQNLHDLSNSLNELKDKKIFWTTPSSLDSDQSCWFQCIEDQEAIEALKSLQTLDIDAMAKVRSINQHFSKIKLSLEISMNKYQSREANQKNPSFDYVLNLNTVPYEQLKALKFLIKVEENQHMDLFQHKFNEVGLRTEDDIKKHHLFEPAEHHIQALKDLKKQIMQKEKQLSTQEGSNVEQEITLLRKQYDDKSRERESQIITNLENYFNTYIVDTHSFLDDQCPNIWENDNFKKCLNVSSKEEAIEALTKMNLKTKKDLDAKRLLPTDEELIVIFNNPDFEEADIINAYQTIFIDKLKTHIEKSDALESIIEPIIFTQQTLSSLQKLRLKVEALIFRLISTGAILVPVYLSPLAAAAGFGIGLSFFILRRFGHLRLIEDFGHKLSVQFPIVSYVFSRNIFSITPTMQSEIKNFTERSFFHKMILLSLHLFIVDLSKFLYTPLSAVTRGFFFGKEIVHMF